MRGAGGGTHSVVVYRLTAAMMGLDGGGWVDAWVAGGVSVEIQDNHRAPHQCNTRYSNQEIWFAGNTEK